MPTSVFKGIALSPLDWLTVIVFLLATAAIALWSRFRQRDTTEDYFLAGRSVSWFIVSITVFATLFSSISFVAIPGEGYGKGMIMSLMLFFMPFTAMLAIWLFLRFFFLSPTYTSYEYLEQRFNAPTRVAGAGVFCLYRLVYSGVVFYAGAELFSSLVGWDRLYTILFVGLFVVLYTTAGGMKAVMATDVMQAGILLIGIGAVLWKVLAVSGYDLAAIYNFAAENGRGYEPVLTSRFWTFNLHERFNIYLLAWMLLIVPIASLSSDQLVVQRLLTSKGYAGAKRATMFNYWMSIPMVLMFWGVGVGLYYIYNAPLAAGAPLAHRAHPAPLPAGIPADRVMGFFIANEVPAPIPGLIIAALLAALMSTISSVVNSVATVVYRDGLVRMRLIDHAPHKEVIAGKILSIAAGFIAVGLAVVLVVLGDAVESTTVLEVNFIWQQLGYMVAGAFVVGVLMPRVGGGAMFAGIVAGACVALTAPWLLYYRVAPAERIAFFWITVPSVMVTILLPLALSVVWPNRKPTAGLTVWTLPTHPAPAPPQIPPFPPTPRPAPQRLAR